MSELNLIPYSLKQKNRKKWLVLEICLAVIIAAAVLTIGIYYPYARLKALQSKEADLKASVSQQNSVKVENAKLKSETDTLKAAIARVDILKKSGVSIYGVLQGMEQYIPKEITITNYSYAAGKLNLSGTSKKYNAIDEFQANLQESGKYVNCRVPTVTRGGAQGSTQSNSQEMWTFTLTIDEVKGETK